MEIKPCQEEIEKLILNKSPAMIARYGSNEALITGETIGIELGAILKIYTKHLVSICRNAGVFPYGQDTAIAFGKMMQECSKDVDIIGCWDTLMQDYLIDTCMKNNVKRTALRNLEPYYAKSPWSAALAKKSAGYSSL